MRYIIAIHLVLFSFNVYCQTIIDECEAIEIALKNGIDEPLDSFEVTLKDDTVWEVKSILCDESGNSESVTYRINAVTGENLEEAFGTMSISIAPCSNSGNTINYSGYVDSLIPVINNQPRLLITQKLKNVHDLRFSPDDNWIAISYGVVGGSIAVVPINGGQLKPICDSCISSRWSSNETLIFYRTNSDQIIETNIFSGECCVLQSLNILKWRASFSPTGEWFAYNMYVPRKSVDTTNLIINLGREDYEEYDLFIQSVRTGFERRITTEGFVSGIYWNRTGDTIFFHRKKRIYYSTGFGNEQLEYGHVLHPQNVPIYHYLNSYNGRFPRIHRCQIIMVDMNTMKPVNFIRKRRGRYKDVWISNNGKYLVYTIKDPSSAIIDNEIYFVENEY
jgi:hypothetical protein